MELPHKLPLVVGQRIVTPSWSCLRVAKQQPILKSHVRTDTASAFRWQPACSPPDDCLPLSRRIPSAHLTGPGPAIASGPCDRPSLGGRSFSSAVKYLHSMGFSRLNETSSECF